SDLEQEPRPAWRHRRVGARWRRRVGFSEVKPALLERAFIRTKNCFEGERRSTRKRMRWNDQGIVDAVKGNGGPRGSVILGGLAFSPEGIASDPHDVVEAPDDVTRRLVLRRSVDASVCQESRHYCGSKSHHLSLATYDFEQP